MEDDKREQSKIHTAFIGVYTGLVAVVIMVVAVITSNSVAVFADLLATFFEWIAVIFSWLTLRRLSRRGGYTFDYGCGKIENLASLVIAILMFMSLAAVGFNAVRRFADPEPIMGFGVWLTLAAHIVYLGINSVLCHRTHQSCKEEPSTLLEAQRRLFWVKAFCNVCMIIALGVGLSFQASRPAMYFDPVMSLLIAASMFLCAHRIVSQNLGALLDRTLDENAQILILRELANCFEEYVALHGVRSRRSGNQVFVELFLEFDGTRAMKEVQAQINRMKANLEAAIPNSEVSIIPSTGKPRRT